MATYLFQPMIGPENNMESTKLGDSLLENIVKFSNSARQKVRKFAGMSIADSS